MSLIPDLGQSLAQNLNRNAALERGERGYFLFVNEPLQHVCSSLSEAKELAKQYIAEAEVLKIERHDDDLPFQVFLYDGDADSWFEVQPNHSYRPERI
jgi:hypothetical protein